MTDKSQENIEKIAEWLYQQDWPLPWSSVSEEVKAPYRVKAKAELSLLASLGFVQLDEDQSAGVLKAWLVGYVLRIQQGLDPLYDEATTSLSKTISELGFRRVILPQEKGK